MSYIWINEAIVNAIHDSQIMEHGDLDGVRDSALLQSALARPINLFSYSQDTKISDLAACYAVAIAKNHPFNDGNKRTAFVVLELFLQLNGYQLTADDNSCVYNMMGTASGEISEQQLSEWISQNILSL